MTGSLGTVVEATCGALARIPVRVNGAWTPGAVLSGSWTRREWQGVARAEEPIVALLIASAADMIEWHKSDRPRWGTGRPAGNGGGSGNEGAGSLDIRLGITTGQDQPLASVFASAGGAHANITAPVPASARAASILDQRATTTGVLFELVALDDTPRVTFSLLFVAASQVEVGRNGLWRVRRTVAPALHEPLRTVLSRRRHGRGLSAGPGRANIAVT